ncbi:peroxisomal acyl-coenzyme A oxidase 3-like [Rhopilema esculentum]|uniref:peroxisomal acyl-coenzyme A oxidase 3-like n=1 Tax=Rhopilema esculentum TaxID=499914 RepID=UPI0031D97025
METKGYQNSNIEKRSTFNIHEMHTFLEDMFCKDLLDQIWRTLQKDPLFQCSEKELTGQMSMEEIQHLEHLRLKRLLEYNFVDAELFIEHPLLATYAPMCFGMAKYGWGLSARLGLNGSMFAGTIKATCTNPDMLELSKKASRLEVYGCFALTEIGHGSNTKAMKTTATYDPKTEEFVINTPHFDAAKCWSGLLGDGATHALVYAQLYTPDNVCHGLHTFVVPVRDPETLHSLPGVTVGDMGKKLGLNYFANGFALFDHVRIPRTHLMNRTADVTPEGQYVSKYKDPQKRHSAALGVLSAGRVGITGMGIVNLKVAITIAIRYSAARKQFGPTPDAEIPVLDYQMQQWRLLPYLAAVFVTDHYFKTSYVDSHEFQLKLMFGEKGEHMDNTGKEIHALSCASKPLTSWLARDGIQECREACGGHGYLSVNRFGSLRDDNDPNCTYEGDNNMLLGQTSNHLLSLLYQLKRGKQIASPLGSTLFLNRYAEILSATNHPDVTTPEGVLAAYDWLVCYLLAESHRKYNEQLAMQKDKFTAKNDSQVYYCRTLAMAFIEHVAIERFYKKVYQTEVPQSVSKVIRNIYMLYGLWSLEKHLATLFQGGFFKNGNETMKLREEILQLCSKLRPDAVTLVDTFAPPDWVLQAPIGLSNGKPLENLYKNFMEDPDKRKRISWWKDVLNQPSDQVPSSKL